MCCKYQGLFWAWGLLSFWTFISTTRSKNTLVWSGIDVLAAKQTPKRPQHVFQSFFSAITICSLSRPTLKTGHFCTNTMLGAKNTAGVMEGRHGTESDSEKPESREVNKMKSVLTVSGAEPDTNTSGTVRSLTGRRQSSFCQLQHPLTARETTVTGDGASGVQSGGGVEGGLVN